MCKDQELPSLEHSIPFPHSLSNPENFDYVIAGAETLGGEVRVGVQGTGDGS